MFSGKKDILLSFLGFGFHFFRSSMSTPASMLGEYSAHAVRRLCNAKCQATMKLVNPFEKIWSIFDENPARIRPAP